MQQTLTNVKWKTLLGLSMIYISIAFYPRFQWLWGVLFLFWSVPSLMTGSTYLLESVERTKNPFLFWIVVLTWIGLSLYILAEAFL